MGNQCGESQKLSNLKLKFYGQIFHLTAGNVTIYKNQLAPFYFIMKTIQTDFDQEKLYLYDCIKSCQSQFLTKLYGWKKKYSQCQGDTNFDSLQCFWDYFTITLQIHAKRKAQRFYSFSQNQLWYIMIYSCQISQFAINNQINILDLSPAYTYLSTQGFLKMNVMDAIKRYNRLYRQKKLYPTLVSPQQLESLKAMNPRELKKNHSKSMAFSAGMLLLCLIQTRQGISFKKAYQKYYDQTSCSIKWYEIKKTLSTAKNFYSYDMINMINYCLIQDFSKRPDLKWIRLRYQKLKVNIKDGIQLYDFDSQEKTKSQSSKSNGSLEYSSKSELNSIKKGYYLKKLIQKSVTQ